MKEELLTRLGNLLKELSAEMERSKERLDQLKAQREKTDQAMKNFKDVENLKKVIDENKQIVDRNNREIEYQRYLVTAVNHTMKEIKNLEVKEQTQNQFEEYFEKLTHNITDLDSEHPFRRDKAFLKSLLDYFESNEDYHSCALIQKQLSELS
jgi:hypothetical protein